MILLTYGEGHNIHGYPKETWEAQKETLLKRKRRLPTVFEMGKAGKSAEEIFDHYKDLGYEAEAINVELNKIGYALQDEKEEKSKKEVSKKTEVKDPTSQSSSESQKVEK